MKVFLGKDAQGEQVKMKWTGDIKDLNSAFPDIVWYATLTEEEDSIAEKAEALGIPVEAYRALEALGRS